MQDHVVNIVCYCPARLRSRLHTLGSETFCTVVVGMAYETFDERASLVTFCAPRVWPIVSVMDG